MKNEKLVKIVEELNGDLENFYFINDGVLVLLEEHIGVDRYLVRNVYEIEERYEDNYTASYDSYELGGQYLYNGKIYDCEKYKYSTVIHDAVDIAKNEMHTLKDKIKELEEQKAGLENSLKIESEKYKGNKAIYTAIQLLEKTKRFIVVRESKIRCFVIDNMSKKLLAEDNIEHNYYTDFKDVEFTFYRDYSSKTNIQDNLFNFSIKLNKENGGWLDEYEIPSYKTIGADIEFFDTIDEVQDILDTWVSNGDITKETYLLLVDKCNLKVKPELGAVLKKQIIDSFESVINNKKKVIESLDKEIIEIGKRIKSCDILSENDVESYIKLIKGY